MGKYQAFEKWFTAFAKKMSYPLFVIQNPSIATATDGFLPTKAHMQPYSFVIIIFYFFLNIKK